MCQWLGQGEHCKAKLAYLCTMVSEKTRTVINFDRLRTMPNALHKIKEYLNMAVMPLTLQRLEMLRYKPPTGKSQTMTTELVI